MDLKKKKKVDCDHRGIWIDCTFEEMRLKIRSENICLVYGELCCEMNCWT